MRKILIVDDSETVRNQLFDLLTLLGFFPVLATNGVEGLVQMRENTDIKLIICDVNMPELDGITFCELMFKEGLTTGIPIFMLTTESSQELKLRGKACGVTAWVAKPLLPDKLSKALFTVLGE